MKRILFAGALVLAVGYVASAQDTTTLLSQFLVDLRNGTWGVSTSVTGLTVTKDAIAATPTTALTLRNTTDATGAATVQMSPRMLFRGNAWDTAATQTVDFFLENLPATAATPTGTFKLGFSRNGAAVTYPLTVASDGVVNTLQSIQSGADLRAASTNSVYWSSRAILKSPADGIVTATNFGGTTGAELKVDALPVTGSCGGGSPAVVAGSTPFAGSITVGTTVSSCVVTFGGTAFPSAPFCVANVVTATAGTTRALGTSATTTALTITPASNFVDGSVVAWVCISSK